MRGGIFQRAVAFGNVGILKKRGINRAQDIQID
jgi:hypothetical protein